MADPRVRAWLSILGFNCDPSDITDRVGVSPDAVWSAGEVIPGRRAPRGEAGWRIRSRLSSEADVEEHANSLLELLPAHLDDFQSPGVCVQFSFAIDIEDETPAISFAAETLARICRLNGSIDIDIYVLGNRLSVEEVRIRE